MTNTISTKRLEVCNQIDGVAMGSPLAPFLAGTFMGYSDSRWLHKCNLTKPKLLMTNICQHSSCF